jgi:hypothetical protein
VTIVTLALVLTACARYEAKAQAPDAFHAAKTFCRFRFAKIIPLDGGNAWGLLYADNFFKMQLFRATEKGFKLEWKNASIGAPVVDFFYTDVEADGRFEIVVATINGRVMIYDAEEYQNVWENLAERFTTISAAAIENIDNDPQMEMVFIANEQLFIYDGLSKSRQWVSTRPFQAREIVIANVDKDDQLEIILNTGVIIDARFLNVQTEWDKHFGDRIEVFDMNNDGYPEIVGELSDYSLRIFDAYTEREVW